METYLPTLTVAGVLGFLAPLLATGLSRLTMKDTTKQLVAVGAAVFMAVIAIAVTNGFRPPQPGENLVVYWILVVLAVIAVSQLAYALIWKPTDVIAKVAVVTSTEKEREQFKAQNTVQSDTVVDSTSTTIADKVVTGEYEEPDATPPGPGYLPRHTKDRNDEW